MTTKSSAVTNIFTHDIVRETTDIIALFEDDTAFPNDISRIIERNYGSGLEGSSVGLQCL
jgi:hypothetical protein